MFRTSFEIQRSFSKLIWKRTRSNKFTTMFRKTRNIRPRGAIYYDMTQHPYVHKRNIRQQLSQNILKGWKQKILKIQVRFHFHLPNHQLLIYFQNEERKDLSARWGKMVPWMKKNAHSVSPKNNVLSYEEYTQVFIIFHVDYIDHSFFQYF